MISVKLQTPVWRVGDRIQHLQGPGVITRLESTEGRFDHKYGEEVTELPHNHRGVASVTLDKEFAPGSGTRVFTLLPPPQTPANGQR